MCLLLTFAPRYDNATRHDEEYAGTIISLPWVELLDWIGWRVENINGKVEEDEEGEYCDIIARVELDCFVLQE